MWATGGRFVGTEDAYVKQDRVSVVPQVSGQIAQVAVAENDAVKAGQLLFTIDDSAYRSAVEEDQARLEQARLEVEKLKAAYQQAVSEEATARDALATAQTRDDRQQTLLKSGVVPQATADDSALALQQAQRRPRPGRERRAERQGGARGQPRHRHRPHPEVLQALAALHAAELDLAHTVVTAPTDGVVSQTDRLQQGQYVTPVDRGPEPGRDRRQLDRGQLQGDRPHPHAPGPAGRGDASTPIPTSASRARSARSAPAPARSSRCCRRRTPAATGSRSCSACRCASRSTPGQDLPPLRAGMSASVEVDTGHARGLPKFVAGPLAALGLGGRAAVARPADAAK